MKQDLDDNAKTDIEIAAFLSHILVVMLVVVVVVVVRTSNIGDLASLVKEIDVLGKSQVVVPHYQPGQYECTHNT